MTTSTRFLLRSVVSLLAAACFWHQTSQAAVSLTISPGSVGNNYTGPITLWISGLTNGEQVAVLDYLDANGSGAVDAGEPLVLALKLEDGRAAALGGVRDINVPDDEDGSTNAQIQAVIHLDRSSELARLAGRFLFQVVSRTHRFDPVAQSLTITQAAYGQSITGQITAAGTPVANAVVALLVQRGGNQEFFAGTVSDASGRYVIGAPAGTYQMIPVKSGYVTGFSTAPQVLLGAGVVVTQNLGMVAASRVVSGQVTNFSNGKAIPGLQLFAQASDDFTIACTDTNGTFNIPVSAGMWKMDISDFSLSQKGLLRPQAKLRADTTSGNVVGLDSGLFNATALFYGTVQSVGNVPLAGIRLYCNDRANQFGISAVTDTNGYYVTGVRAGDWFIGPDNRDPSLAGYLFQGTNTAILDGQAMPASFVVQRSTAHLIGHVVDPAGNPLSGHQIIAVGTGSQASAVTGNDGGFDLGVAGGAWTLQLNNGDSSNTNLVGPSLTFNVADGVNITGIGYVARFVTAGITGKLQDGAGTPLGGVNIYAFLNVSGTNYSQSATTDSGGNYRMGVSSGTWRIGVDCQALNGRGYQCVPERSVTVAAGNQIVDFIAQTGPPDVSGFVVGKIQWNWQSDAGVVLPATNSPSLYGNATGPFEFFALAVPSAPGALASAAVVLPASTASRVLNAVPGFFSPEDFVYLEDFGSKGALDAAYPNGTYSMGLNTTHNGMKSVPLQLTGDAYPPTPQFGNFAAAQAVNAAADFTLTWGAFANASNGDRIAVRIFGTNTQPVFATSLGKPDSLPISATSAVVPANTLQPGRTYLAQLSFFRTSQSNSTGYPGAVGLAQYGGFTTMNLVTIRPPAPQLLQPAISSDQFRFQFAGPDGLRYRIEASTNLTAWTPVITNQVQGGMLLFTNPVAGVPYRFFRALELP